MAEEHVDSRPINFRQWFPWLEIFRGFQVALDPKKMVVAAAGILAMACWWWFWSVVFYHSQSKPDVSNYAAAGYQPKSDKDLPPGKTIEQVGKEAAWAAFRQDRLKWDLLHETAGDAPVSQDASDIANDYDDFQRITGSEAYNKASTRANEAIQHHDYGQFPIHFLFDGKDYKLELKAWGKISTWPFFEDRGPNPYLLVTGKAGNPAAGRSPLEWFVSEQTPVLIEPLVKFMRPVVYFFHYPAGFLNYIYLTIILVGTLAIWALFGGMITRMAAVQIARRERIGVRDAWKFTKNRWLSFFSAPLLPLGIVLVVVLLTILFGVIHLIPALGDVVDGVFWFLIIGAGLVMTVVLIGLVGWPMMYATVSAEGSDTFDALSRSYSYVYQNPWSYVWYCAVAMVYGMVLVFFVGLVGSMTIYLGKWGLSQTPFLSAANREPEYLFRYAPTSYGWRDLLMHGNPAAYEHGTIKPDYLASMTWYNSVGAVLVSVWLYVIFLLVLGFAYTYFWTASTIIYLLMRRKVDDTELDEVFLEEEEPESPYSEPPPEEKAEAAPAHVPEPTHVAQPVMVEPPTLKTPTAAEHTPGPSEPAPAPSHGQGGDGSPSSGAKP
jgi:hypothetical protein